MVTFRPPLAVVIGAGLAGSAVAYALSRAGAQVTVLEGGKEPALGASGNPVGIFHPFISKDNNLASQWFREGIGVTLRWLKDFSASDTGWFDACGVMQVAQSVEEALAWRELVGKFQYPQDWLSFEESRAGFGPGLWSERSGWIKPREFILRMLKEASGFGAEIKLNCKVESIGTNEVFLADGTALTTDHIVVCAGEYIEKLIPDAELSLMNVRGEIDSYDLSSGGAPFVVCKDGYVTPVIDGKITVGATFERPGSKDSVSNQDRLENIAPELARVLKNQTPQKWASTRSVTIDRMPIVGRAADLNVPLAKSISRLSQVPRRKTLWVVGGLGSRGLSSAPLCAEVIADTITGKTPLISESLLRAVDPARFALRRHQRE